VKNLIWEPEFHRVVRDAFAPVGLMVDFAKEKVFPDAKPAHIPVVVINDLDQPWNGPVTLRLKSGTRLLKEMKQECHLEPLGKNVVNFEFPWPDQLGACSLEAELTGADGQPVRSLRDTEIVDARSFGLAFQKTVTASSVHAPEYSPANAVDGNPSTYWSSTFADPAWLAVDLGAEYRISHIRINWEAAFSKAYAVQVSVDGQKWTDVYQTGDGKGGISEIKFASTPARHVRISCMQRATQWGHAIRELEVFE
jgi:hypothetical protein